MKKLLTIIALFVSSFFFISLKEAKAAEQTINITKTSDTYITDEFFRVKKISDSYANDNNYYYTIIFSSDVYTIYFATISEVFVFDSTGWFQPLFTYEFSEKCSYNDNNLNCEEYVYGHNIAYNKYYGFLYSTINYYSNIERVVTYNGKEYPFNATKKAVSMYDLFIIDNPSFNENPHQDEIDKLSNFYNVIIEKISYLAEQIVSNYIYLSIIVIFILIFVFLLIFRRHL